MFACHEPTAWQLVVVGHDTPFKTAEAAPLGLGTATIDHVVPFQRSIRRRVIPLFSLLPTAKQVVVLGHDTRLSTDTVAPVGLRLGTTDQVEPFHRSTNVCVVVPT